MLIKQFVIAILFIFLSSCSFRPDILIQDQSGAPVAGAALTPISLSMQYKPIISDKHGHIRLGKKIQKIEFIVASKEGFETTKQIPYQGTRPIKIRLTAIK